MIVYNKIARNVFPPNPSQILWKEISPLVGRGLFARVALSANSCLWEEDPLLSASTLTDLVQKISCDDNDGTKYEHLCHPAATDDNNNNNAGIAYCNHFCARYDLYLLFSHISLLNHSCHPNVSIELTTNPIGNDDEEKKIQASVHTIRDIGPGEELVLSYLGSDTLFGNYLKRQHVLKSKWGFTCHCDRCHQWEIKVKPSRSAPPKSEMSRDSSWSSSQYPEVWSLFEKAATIADANKPRQQNVDPECLVLQKEAANTAEQVFPSWKDAERFRADVLYFS